MDYYEKKRRAGLAVSEWLRKDDREPFSDFARKQMDLYGFDSDAIKKILEKRYPKLTIINDEVVKHE